jgi:hypothetical protein
MKPSKPGRQIRRPERIVGRDEVFRKEWIKTSEYPGDFVPKGAEIFIGVDQGSPDGDYTAKGFYDPKTGEFHVQEVTPNAQVNAPLAPEK